MEWIKIRHPEAGEATVPESSVPHWRSRGWRPVKEQAEGKKPRRDSGGNES